MKSSSKRNLVLFSLFVVPLLFYVLLQLGTMNFAKLPIVTKNVIDVNYINKKYSFTKAVTVVVFAGDDLSSVEAELYNLNQKVYKKFYGYTDFQLMVFLTKEQKEKIKSFRTKIGINTNTIKWNFITASPEEIKALFSSFKTNLSLNEINASSYSFIIDKELNLRRGKTTIKTQEDAKLFGYHMKSITELKNDMHDDVKVILAEYSLALKKNGSSEERRKKSLKNEKN